MKASGLQEMLAWMRKTDLVEIAWRRGEEAVELRLENAPPASAPFPSTTLVPVPSPGVGLFRFSEPGKPRTAVEGRAVAPGDTLGMLETGAAPVKVSAPSGGKLAKVLIDEGKAVEYGQLLFLIAP